MFQAFVSRVSPVFRSTSLPAARAVTAALTRAPLKAPSLPIALLQTPQLLVRNMAFVRKKKKKRTKTAKQKREIKEKSKVNAPGTKMIRGPVVPNEDFEKTDLRQRFTMDWIEGAQNSNLIHRVLSMTTASQEEKNSFNIARAMERFQRFVGDTGSPEVQVATLTERIKYLTKHLRVHEKDVHSRRGLEILVAKRKKMLAYLKNDNLVKWKAVVQALGIRAR